MNKHLVQQSMLSAAMAIALLALFSNVGMTETGPRQFPPARKVPGLNTEDKFPNGCVDCHINMPDINQDERISTLMSRWTENVETKLLEKAQSVASDVKLKGVHPPASESLEDIPSACLNCHSSTSNNTAPPFAALLHVIHLTGGDENHFMTIFQGECTHCHKINVDTGRWTIPSGSEK